MRIISGKYKGKKLFYPKDKSFRPTQDRVRESIFNIVKSYGDFQHILDCFCGTGSFGLEAYSRGAKRVVCVDREITYAKKNLESLQCNKEECLVIKQSVPTFLKRTKEQFDLIFIDPPWKELNLYSDSLKAISDFDILSEQGLIICESNKESNIIYSHFDEIDTKVYGSTKIALLKK